MHHQWFSMISCSVQGWDNDIKRPIFRIVNPIAHLIDQPNTTKFKGLILGSLVCVWVCAYFSLCCNEIASNLILSLSSSLCISSCMLWLSNGCNLSRSFLHTHTHTHKTIKELVKQTKSILNELLLSEHMGLITMVTSSDGVQYMAWSTPPVFTQN